MTPEALPPQADPAALQWEIDLVRHLTRRPSRAAEFYGSPARAGARNWEVKPSSPKLRASGNFSRRKPAARPHFLRTGQYSSGGPVA
jgi:hypothetical protein